MVLSTLNQSLAFHTSPENFISDRLQDLLVSDPDLVPSKLNPHKIVQASILNRKVHIISSYVQCKDILRGAETSEEVAGAQAKPKTSPPFDTYAAGPAYHQLMADWFPPPNILLEDGLPHTTHKNRWKQQLSNFPRDIIPQIRKITIQHINTFPENGTFDLYESLKDLSWKLLLGAFLNLEPTDRTYTTIESAQESLLRGQFSLFPVSVNTRFWQSPRSKGFKARQDLQAILKEQVKKQEQTCPFLRHSEVDLEDLSSHSLLFTSSIANKALASLLTATVMNLFLQPGSMSLAAIVRSQPPENRETLLDSILFETERLSPPVVGVMRRVLNDVKLSLSADGNHHPIPAGCDVWLYFVGANRDSTIFPDAEKFIFDRYMAEETPRGLAFGSGTKTCLGQDTVHQMILTVLITMIDVGIMLHGNISDLGVRGWLGWDAEVAPSVFAKDLKQLPCQRPRKPVIVTASSVLT
ncbi:hypothetical protein MMC19_007186 [Ptychographa xylographoides]|nr:hypothetical protein [Ptychographa xylographoides]